MEVHHHPHVEKKKFKEYCFEFLMIFLAVTMGFFTENARELIVDKRRTHEFMKEIVENLKYDTTRVRLNLAFSDTDIRGMDSLRSELGKAIAGNINGNRLYYFAKRYAGEFGNAVFNTSAITELKNSGALRLVKNKSIVSDLDDYYQRRIFAAGYKKPSTELVEDQRRMLDEVFSWKYFDDQIANADKTSSLSTRYDFSFVLSADPPMQLLKTKPEDLEALYNMISQFEYKVKEYDFFLDYARKLAVKLIGEIETEYHLTHETELKYRIE